MKPIVRARHIPNRGSRAGTAAAGRRASCCRCGTRRRASRPARARPRSAPAGVHVEEVTAPGVAVADVAEPSHVRAVRDQREQQHADQRNARATQYRGRRAVIAKSLAQRRRQSGAGGARADGERDQDGDGHGHGTDREPPPRRAGIARGQRRHRTGRQPVKAEERLLVDQVPQGELHVPWARVARHRRAQGDQGADADQCGRRDEPHHCTWGTHCGTGAMRERAHARDSRGTNATPECATPECASGVLRRQENRRPCPDHSRGHEEGPVSRASCGARCRVRRHLSLACSRGRIWLVGRSGSPTRKRAVSPRPGSNGSLSERRVRRG